MSGENTPQRPETALEGDVPRVLNYEGAQLVDKRHYACVERRCVIAEDCVEELEREVEEMTVTSRARGVNGYAAMRREFDKKDMQNERKVSNMVQKMYDDSHFPPVGWRKWTTRERIVCQRMGRIVELQRGVDLRCWWESTGSEMAKWA